MEKLTNRDSNESRATPIAPNNEQTRNDSSPHIISMMLSTWSEISRSTRHQAPTWLLPWRTWIAFPMLLNIRTFEPTYGRIWSRPWDRPLLGSKGFKPYPIRRSPPTRLITAAPHRDLVGTVVAVHLPTIEGRAPVTTIVVGTLAVTMIKDVDVVKWWTRIGIYGTTSPLRMPANASTGALWNEWYMKTCDALSTMQHMAPPA